MAIDTESYADLFDLARLLRDRAGQTETCDRCHRQSASLVTARATHEAGPATTCAPVLLCPACVRALLGDGDAPRGDL